MNCAELIRLQQIQLEILKDFDLFCKQRGLKYYLIGGALLGAARYGKFIPWDDDVDVAMFREDYEKLQQIWPDRHITGYFLQSGKTDPLYARSILKIRRNGTHIIEKICKDVNIHNGIYIDIFPIDYADSDTGRKMDFRGIMVRILLTLRNIKSGYSSGKWEAVKKLIHVLTLPINNRFIDRKIEEICTCENNGTRRYSVLYLHNYGWKRQIHPCAVFGEGKECCFAGYHFSAPSDSDSFLKKVFGDDYMAEPPADKQRNPHNFLEISYEK